MEPISFIRQQQQKQQLLLRLSTVNAKTRTKCITRTMPYLLILLIITWVSALCGIWYLRHQQAIGRQSKSGSNRHKMKTIARKNSRATLSESTHSFLEVGPLMFTMILAWCDPKIGCLSLLLALLSKIPVVYAVPTDQADDGDDGNNIDGIDMNVFLERTPRNLEVTNQIALRRADTMNLYLEATQAEQNESWLDRIGFTKTRIMERMSWLTTLRTRLQNRRIKSSSRDLHELKVSMDTLIETSETINDSTWNGLVQEVKTKYCKWLVDYIHITAEVFNWGDDITEKHVALIILHWAPFYSLIFGEDGNELDPNNVTLKWVKEILPRYCMIDGKRFTWTKIREAAKLFAIIDYVPVACKRGEKETIKKKIHEFAGGKAQFDEFFATLVTLRGVSIRRNYRGSANADKLVPTLAGGADPSDVLLNYLTESLVLLAEWFFPHPEMYYTSRIRFPENWLYKPLTAEHDKNALGFIGAVCSLLPETSEFKVSNTTDLFSRRAVRNWPEFDGMEDEFAIEEQMKLLVSIHLTPREHFVQNRLENIKNRVVSNSKCSTCKTRGKWKDGLCKNCHPDGKCTSCKTRCKWMDDQCQNCHPDGKCTTCNTNLKWKDGLCQNCRSDGKCTTCNERQKWMDGLCKNCHPDGKCTKCNKKNKWGGTDLCKSCHPDGTCTKCNKRLVWTGKLCKSCHPDGTCTKCNKRLVWTGKLCKSCHPEGKSNRRNSI